MDVAAKTTKQTQGHTEETWPWHQNNHNARLQMECENEIKKAGAKKVIRKSWLYGHRRTEEQKHPYCYL